MTLLVMFLGLLIGLPLKLLCIALIIYLIVKAGKEAA